MKRILSIIAVLTMSIVLVSCTTGKEFDFTRGTLVVGLEADYPPFNWEETTKSDTNVAISGEANSYAAGYDVEIAKLIAAHLDLELVIKKVPWLALPEALRSNQIDIIIAGMSPTEERKENILFSNPYYSVNHVVVAKDGGILDGMQSTGLTALEGKKGIGQLNTIYDELITLAANEYGATRLAPLDSAPALAIAVESNVADFMIVEEPVALGMVANNANLKIVYRPEGNVFNLTEGDLSLSIGMRLIDTTLQTRLNEALATITLETRTRLMNEAVLASKDN